MIYVKDFEENVNLFRLFFRKIGDMALDMLSKALFLLNLTGYYQANPEE